ncbi:BTAD domain-containing putative transcriptional regulator [Nocardia jejuensis]|uniref:BTAD domain-containing putative transcriptional regulator n=1 Tax=Nocardia jejuensis TaxID=328049 RepID=UPI00082B775E|nr:BTAD domain-containing putative transcriptional regulator [Nocardia jejuensis]
MRVGVLGPIEVHAEDGTPVEIGGVRVRMLAARLALEAGGSVPVAALIDGLWGEDPPTEAAGALQALVSRLRRALREAGTVELVAGGYRLSEVIVDAERFEALATRGRRELAQGHAESAASVLSEALGLWRGAALCDVLDAPYARTVAVRLEDLRAAVAEDRFEAELRLGRHATILADLDAAGTEHPLRERLAALRMRALAAAGRQSDALAVYEDVRARLDDDLGIDPSAELRETHLALLRGELETRTVAREPIGSILPARLTSFIGREADLEGLARLVAAARLVTIVGPGGAGKTRLSIEAMSAQRPGPVFFVPLAEIGAPDQLADAVAGALDATAGESRADKTARLSELLDVGAAVLILDNCEHLLDAAATLAEDLLTRLPQLRILATSREPLAVTGETLWHLGPLAVPSESTEPAAAERASSVRLFVDRAAAARPGFTSNAHTLGPILEICRRLDGMPLALELAAAKLRSMSVDHIAQRLDDRFRLLSTGSRTALPRQRTLHALVEWSWDLLEEPERALARRLSMFPGGATIAALEATCADETLPARDVLYVLGSLVEKSIVESSSVAPYSAAGRDVSDDAGSRDDAPSTSEAARADEQPRYRMLETIRAYAAEQLVRSGEDFADRYGEYFLALAEANEPALRTGAQLEAIALFDAEHANMAAALRTALTDPSPEVSTRWVRALFWYWGIRGMSTQFETSLRDVLRLGTALRPEARAALRVIELMAGSFTVQPGAAPALIEECTRAGGLDFHPAVPLWTALVATRAEAADLAERQLELALSWPDPWVRASAHLARDFALTGRGEQPAGAEARGEALRGFETVGDRWGLGVALLAVGRDHSLRGDHDRALACFSRAVAVASELGTEDDIFAARTELATERMRAGDLLGAERDIDAARRLATERGFPRLAAAVLFDSAELHRRRGDVTLADRDLDRVEQRIGSLPYPERMAADRIIVARLANRLTAADAPAARKLLPLVIAGSLLHGDPATVAQAVARSAQLLAKLRFLEGEPVDAATGLGTSEVIRGVFDHGDPELRALTAALKEQLGESAFLDAYGRGARVPRPVALQRLSPETSDRP